ncbi:MAG: hypothetical protein GX786_09475, partial [Clostridiales bacterium]|nr:hypothetical protein [Clostridiales bacterium]
MTDKRFAFIKDQAHSLLHKAHITNFPVDLSQVANHIPQLTLLPFSQGKKALSLSEETLVSLQQQSPV